MKGLITGWKNYYKDTDVPVERLEEIANCPHAVEPVLNSLKVKDRYKETNGKICELCFCPLPAKARQNINKCPCWKK